VNGIAILGALPGSPAEECGLKYGDILLSVNGEAMSTLEDFLRARASAQDTMALLVRRGGHVMELSIKLNKANRNKPISAAEAIQQIQHLRLMPAVSEQGLLN
jgi:S1-C subfamily serine protease